MNVKVYGYRYVVWDTDDPNKRRFYVGKDKSCTCGCCKCEHVAAVVDYLKKGGKRAPDNTEPKQETLECKILRIRALRAKAIAEGTLGSGAMAILSSYGNHFTEVERTAWIGLYSMPGLWPIEPEHENN